MHLEREMRGYQRAMVSFIKDTKKCALFVDMGLGKSVSVLTAVRELQLEFELGRTLVVGPPRVVRKVWPDEIKNWDHTQAITATSLQTTPKNRLKRLKSASDMHLISHDLVPWLDGYLQERKHDYDMIVIDESSGFKNQSSYRWKAMRRLVRSARYVVLMTGTPAANGLQDLWGQIYLLDGGARLGHTETDFKERWFTKEWDGHGIKPKSFAEKAIKGRIEDICFTLLDKDYSELPPRLNNTVAVDLGSEMMQTYKRFEREYVLEMEDGKEITAISAAAMTQKLQQLSNGIVYDRDKGENFLHHAKIDALKDIVAEAAGEPMIVAYQYRSDIGAILKAFPEAVPLGNKTQTIDDWNAGLIPMLVMHPKSGGHGL
ncbi:MAG: SNF2-related protein, partial [Pseudomonadota bacterium]|nr:SNF2-related protein [Pseudomonadota bacterium]